MKLLRVNRSSLVFEMGRREKTLLQQLLSLYPRIPPGHHRISRNQGEGGGDKEKQRLLDEALTTQREQNRKEVTSLLEASTQSDSSKAGWRLTLTRAQVECLLQVLNDVRVGSWLLLGSPDTEQSEQVTLTEETGPHYWAMELAAMFESFLLTALDGRKSNATGD